MVERTNQTLFRKLKKINNFSPENWENKIEKATRAINLSYNRAIKTSPFEFKFGRLPSLPIDIKFGRKEIKRSIQNLQNIRDQHFQEYSEKNIQKGKINCSNDYKIGDRVLVFTGYEGCKFAARWKEGYIIKKQINEDAWMVTKNYDQNKEYRINKKHLRLDSSLLLEGSVVDQ